MKSRVCGKLVDTLLEECLFADIQRSMDPEMMRRLKAISIRISACTFTCVSVATRASKPWILTIVG